jgi:hypothetical protein
MMKTNIIRGPMHIWTVMLRCSRSLRLLRERAACRFCTWKKTLGIWNKNIGRSPVIASDCGQEEENPRSYHNARGGEGGEQSDPRGLISPSEAATCYPGSHPLRLVVGGLIVFQSSGKRPFMLAAMKET